MDGFKETFQDLYSSSADEHLMAGGSGYSVVNITTANNYTSSFCGPSNDLADSENITKTCGSGNGASAASKIVSRQ